MDTYTKTNRHYLFYMRILKELFGERWLSRIIIFIFIYSIITFWPILVFYKDINFNPAAFTQDWIKTFIGLSFLFLVLEYQKVLFDIRRKNAVLREILKRDLLGPIKAYMHNLQIEDPGNKRVDALFAEWAVLYPSLQEINLNEYASKLNEQKLLTFLSSYDINSINAKIRAAYATNQPLDKQYLIDVLGEFAIVLNKEIKRLE